MPTNSTRARIVLSLLLLTLLAGCGDWLTKDYAMGARVDDDGSGDSGGSPDDDDGDQLSNAVEELFDMEPRIADSDHDGFDDGLEFVADEADPLHGGLSPEPFNRAKVLKSEDARQGQSDRDQDGLGDNFESEHSLDPDSPDTDDDGYGDGLELLANSDPFVSSSRPQRDSPPGWDGIERTGSGPSDRDGDGLSDSIESLNGTNSNSRDTDTDGYSDGIEYLMGSDADSHLSVPNFSVPSPPDDEDDDDQNQEEDESLEL